MRGTERLDRCSPSAGTGAIPGTRMQPVQLSIKEIKSGIKKYITYFYFCLISCSGYRNK